MARHVLPHEPALRAHLQRWRLPPGLDADDVIQESYAKLASREAVEDIRNARSYLFQIARSVVLMHMRHARVIPIQALEQFGDRQPADEPTVETQVSDREQLRLLAVAVSQLPEPGRTAFLLRTLQDLSHREIGARLGLSDNAVQKILAKSLLGLMNRLGRGGNGLPQASIAGGTEEPSDEHVHARDKRRD